MGFSIVDMYVANRIMELSDEAIDLIFKPYLSKDKLKALKSRVHGVQKWLEANILKTVDPDSASSSEPEYKNQKNTYFNQSFRAKTK